MFVAPEWELSLQLIQPDPVYYGVPPELLWLYPRTE